MQEHQTILITGASSGIGYATALRFAQAGFNVIGTARDTARLTPLAEAIATLPQPHGQFVPFEADVQNAEMMQHIIQQTIAQFGKLDVVMANAGVGHRGGVAESNWNDIDTLIQTNIYGVLHTIRAAIPHMKQQQHGHIILISSVTYNMVVPYAAYYAASKAFISSLGRSLRLELEDDHIHVTDMIVGRTDTSFNTNRLGGQRTGESVPTLSPEDVAEGIFKAVERKKRVGYLRFFDRLTVFGNIIVPNIIGQIAKKQYK